MKNVILPSLIVAFAIIASCRKEEAAILPENGEITESHCGNGVMDGDEDGIDCGPSCAPCVQFFADCGGLNPADNTFTTTGGVSLDFSAGTVVADTTTGVMVITATLANKNVKLTFNTTKPEAFKSYKVVNTNPDDGELRLVYYSGTGYYYGYSDFVVLNRMNGKLNLEFCDVMVSIPSGGFNLAKGRLIEN